MHDVCVLQPTVAASVKASVLGAGAQDMQFTKVKKIEEPEIGEFIHKTLTLRIMRTHSVAKLRADVVTSSGCTTFSSSMLLTVPCSQ